MAHTVDGRPGVECTCTHLTSFSLVFGRVGDICDGDVHLSTTVYWVFSGLLAAMLLVAARQRSVLLISPARFVLPRVMHILVLLVTAIRLASALLFALALYAEMSLLLIAALVRVTPVVAACNSLCFVGRSSFSDQQWHLLVAGDHLVEPAAGCSEPWSPSTTTKPCRKICYDSNKSGNRCRNHDVVCLS